MHSAKTTSFLSKNTTDQYLTNNLLAISAAVIVASALVLFPEVSEAANTVINNQSVRSGAAVKGDAHLKSAADSIKGLITGNFGVIIAMLSVGFAAMSSISAFNPKAWAGAFGVSLAANLAPSAIETIVGANF